MPEAASDVSLQRLSDGKTIAHFTVFAGGITFEGHLMPIAWQGRTTSLRYSMP